MPGATIAMRVTPRASRAAVVQDGDVICIRVTAGPVDGKATEAARDALAVAMGVARTRLTLLRGTTSRN